MYLASEVQKLSNAPVPGQTLVTKASKSRAISPYVPGVTLRELAADKCNSDHKIKESKDLTRVLLHVQPLSLLVISQVPP